MTAKKRPCPSCGGGLSRSDRDGDWCWSCRYIAKTLGQTTPSAICGNPQIAKSTDVFNSENVTDSRRQKRPRTYKPPAATPKGAAGPDKFNAEFTAPEEDAAGPVNSDVVIENARGGRAQIGRDRAR
jgi:hypothetical protein